MTINNKAVVIVFNDRTLEEAARLLVNLVDSGFDYDSADIESWKVKL